MTILMKIICMPIQAVGQGASCSCNSRYAKTALKLQRSARRRTRRRGCTCVFKRPAWLRIRRKTHRKIYCCTKNAQVTINEKPPTIITWSPNENCYCDNVKSYRSQGTETCFCEDNLNTGDVKCLDKTSKNVCRFTVDAYFV